MSDIASDVFAYGLAAGLSASAFLATVIVLSSERGAINAAALFGGFAMTLGLAVAGAALVVDLITQAGGQQLIATLAKLAIGLLLLGGAWKVRPGQPDAPDMGAKLAGMTVKLRGLEPALAFRVGIGLAVLPKRLAITLLAGAAIGASGVTLGQGIALALLYVLTATGLIWITLAAYVLGGNRAATSLEAGRTWVMANVEILAFSALLFFGVLFAGQALIDLLL